MTLLDTSALEIEPRSLLLIHLLVLLLYFVVVFEMFDLFLLLFLDFVRVGCLGSKIIWHLEFAQIGQQLCLLFLIFDFLFETLILRHLIFG